MIKKSLLLTVGSLIFIIGVILFPVPVPLGLPTMILGLAIIFKASNKIKRRIIKTLDKNQHTRKAWDRIRIYRKRKKANLST